jgi:RNA polymerase sigma factor for flagellar operon FliA
VSERLIQDDYAVLRKFRGESAIATYLTVVVAMILRDFRVRRWGRWRPSAAARRSGTVAVRLEALVYRQGCQLEEAIRIVKASGETSLSARELTALFAGLPRRTPMRLLDVGADSLQELASNDRADDSLEDSMLSAERAATDRALRDALLRIPSDDRVLLQMRYWEGMSIADIARALHIPQKPLYRRVEQAVASLRPLLEAAGVSADTARELIESAPGSTA